MLRHFIRIKQTGHLLKQNLALQRVFFRNEHSQRFPKDESTVEKSSEESNPFTKITSVQEAQRPLVQQDIVGDHERLKKLKVLQLEADIAYQEGRRVPKLTYFQDKHWDNVLTLTSRSARIKYYAYLWQNERNTINKEKKEIERKQAILARKEIEKKNYEENPHIIYAPTHTTLFLRIYDSTINHWHNNKLTRAMQFGEKIVLDCSYDEHMNKQEALNTAKQLTLCFAENRNNDDPFDLHFCNVNFNSICMQSLQRSIPIIHDPEFPINIHKKCFTEVFPKEKLVYLTPHCKTDLKEYNPDDIYIIGAIVDKVKNGPVSLGKAKKLGIRMARFPLDRYLQWVSGSGKSLTVNQSLSIMLDLKRSGDWNKALMHVPRRKVANMEPKMRHSYFSRHRLTNKIHIDKDFEHDGEDIPKKSSVRNYSQNLHFNLDTWGSKKKQNS